MADVEHSLVHFDSILVIRDTNADDEGLYCTHKHVLPWPLSDPQKCPAKVYICLFTVARPAANIPAAAIDYSRDVTAPADLLVR